MAQGNKIDKTMDNVKKGVAHFIDDAKDSAEKAADKTAEFIRKKSK